MGKITVDANGHYVNTTDYDWDYGITTDRGEIESAAKAAREMIRVLEKAAKPGKDRNDPNAVGFFEADCLALLDSFLIVGQWSRGSGYEQGVAMHFTFHRKPRSIPPGQKYSQLLNYWLHKFVIAWDPKDRRKCFDEIQALMFDFVWQFDLKLIDEDPKRAAKFEADLRKLVQQDYRNGYRFRW